MDFTLVVAGACVVVAVAVIGIARWMYYMGRFNGMREGAQRWSHFLRQPAKVDSMIQRTIHHEDAETVFG